MLKARPLELFRVVGFDRGCPFLLENVDLRLDLGLVDADHRVVLVSLDPQSPAQELDEILFMERLVTADLLVVDAVRDFPELRDRVLFQRVVGVFHRVSPYVALAWP